MVLENLIYRHVSVNATMTLLGSIKRTVQVSQSTVVTPSMYANDFMSTS